MLAVKRLHFERNDNPIFSDINFALKPGEMLQVMGENGVGKTTLLRTLCGLQNPTQGEILWQQKSIKYNRDNYLRDMIYIGHRLSVKNKLTVRENMQWMHVGAQHVASMFDVLLKINLTDYENNLAENLSAGQQRRLALAKLLLLKAKLWILDEPFNALDSKGVELVKEMFTQHLADNGMIVFTSHQSFKFSNLQQQTLLL